MESCAPGPTATDSTNVYKVVTDAVFQLQTWREQEKPLLTLSRQNSHNGFSFSLVDITIVE